MQNYVLHVQDPKRSDSLFLALKCGDEPLNDHVERFKATMLLVSNLDPCIALVAFLKGDHDLHCSQWHRELLRCKSIDLSSFAHKGVQEAQQRTCPRGTNAKGGSTRQSHNKKFSHNQKGPNSHTISLIYLQRNQEQRVSKILTAIEDALTQAQYPQAL